MDTAMLQDIANGLNSIIRGWLNYFDIQGVSYPAISKRKLRVYLSEQHYIGITIARVNGNAGFMDKMPLRF